MLYKPGFPEPSVRPARSCCAIRILETAMKIHHVLATGSFALCAFLAASPVLAQDHVDANGMPTNHSTPAEHAQTATLNNQISSANSLADAQAAQNNAQYQAAQQQYQEQLRQNQEARQQYEASKKAYENQAAAYENLRTHYVAEYGAYDRDGSDR
jgi:hypothetical protein